MVAIASTAGAAIPITYSTEFYSTAGIVRVSVDYAAKERTFSETVLATPPYIKITYLGNIIVIKPEEVGDLAYDDILSSRVFLISSGKDFSDPMFYVVFSKKPASAEILRSQVEFFFSKDKYIKRITSIARKDNDLVQYRTKFSGKDEKLGYLFLEPPLTSGQPGDGQPATQPADKAPVKDQPSTPMSKDAPR